MKNTRLCLLSLIVGLFAGLAGATFRWLLNEAVFLREFMFAHQQSLLFHGSIILSMFLVAMFIYWLTRKVPFISGSGIPQSRGAIFGRFKFTEPWRQFFAKYFGSLGAIGMGLSLGREGPSVMMGTLGGTIAANSFHATSTEKRYLMSAGAAAGLAAAFTAPIASTIFLLGDTMRWVSWRLVVPALLACIVAGYCAQVIVPYNAYLNVECIAPNVSMATSVVMFIALAVIAAFIGKLFNLTLFHTKDWYAKFKAQPWIKILVVIIVTYIGAMLVLDLVAGGETELIKQALSTDGNVWWLFAMVIIKIALTALCYSTGLCGSLLLPLVVLGGLTGKGFALLLIQLGLISPISAGFFTLIGMTTIFVAVVRAPISGMMLILEMTGRYEVFLPLVITGTITFVIGNYLNTQPVYHTLYSMMITEEHRNPKNHVETHFEIGADSYWLGKQIAQLSLPGDSNIVSVNGIQASSYTMPLREGDLVAVTLLEGSYETLFKVYRSMSDE